VWFQNRRAKWRKKENTKKGPGRPAHNSHPTTCSGEPMDPEEIARRELQRLEKKKRKQERKLLKSQNKFLSSELLHTPGSDSDVSQSTDNESAQRSVPTSSTHGRRHDPDADPDTHTRSMALCPGADFTRPSSLHKLNPFSVESLLADSSPKRKPAPFSNDFPQSPVVGKGHFLLYPITQPLGFIVPQKNTDSTHTLPANNTLCTEAKRPKNEQLSPGAHHTHTSHCAQEEKSDAERKSEEVKATSINFFSNLSNSSSSVGSDHTGQPSLPTCITEARPPKTLSPVHHCSFLGPLFIDTDHCRPGTPHKSCSFGDVLIQWSSHHNLALHQTRSNPYACPFFLLLTHQL
ncbi:hypothetical protein QTP86_000877, partial [Hemibagrus guttatus]